MNAARIPAVLALFASLSGAGLASIAALSRGGTVAEQVLLVAVSCAIVAGAHVLPSLGKGWLAWSAWLGCVVCSLFAHASFVVIAAQHAGDVRGQYAPHIIALQQQKADVRVALNAIHARPLADVAADLSQPHDWRTAKALQTEKHESEKAAALRAELVRLSAVATDAATVAEADPVTAGLSAVSGVSPPAITLIVGFVFAVCLEILAIAAWRLALRPQRPADETQHNHGGKIAPNVDMERLCAAVEKGMRPTLSNIRSTLRIGQSKASTLRREYLQLHGDFNHG